MESAIRYGLSYTRFAYSDLTVENRTVRVAVTNIGDCPGAEVAQLYIAPPRTGPYRPAKELKGFARVYLTPGESRTVDFPLQDDPPLEPGRFSMEDSIMEMKDFSPLMMQAFRGTEATIAQGFGGKADYSNPDFRMMIMSGADAPLRAAVLSSGGSFPAAAAQGLLAAANGQTDGPA